MICQKQISWVAKVVIWYFGLHQNTRNYIYWWWWCVRVCVFLSLTICLSIRVLPKVVIVYVDNYSQKMSTPKLALHTHRDTHTHELVLLQVRVKCGGAQSMAVGGRRIGTSVFLLDHKNHNNPVALISPFFALSLSRSLSGSGCLSHCRADFLPFSD